MKIIEEGHLYHLDSLDGDHEQVLRFVKRFRGKDNYSGTTNQEVIRVLIDRVKFLHEEKPWELNKDIIHHLRMALVLHEARALLRKSEKGEIFPESVLINPIDGHFEFNKELNGR